MSFLPENSYPGLCRSLRKLPVQSRQWRPKAHGKFQIGGNMIVFQVDHLFQGFLRFVKITMVFGKLGEQQVGRGKGRRSLQDRPAAPV